MLTCSRCQTENQDNSRLCRECGNPLPTQGLAQASPPRPGAPISAPATCPSCGEPASAGSQFCSRCGKSFSAVADYGGFWRRFFGYLLDTILINVAFFILAVIVAIAILGSAPEVAFTQEQVEEQEDAQRNTTIAISLIGLIIGFGYFVGLNAYGGTLGKRAVGLRVEKKETGEDIGIGSSLIRYIVALASAVALLVGYFWCIWDDRKQTWHDMAAGAVVVRT